MKPYAYAAFLRGINVGGHKKIRMEDLRNSLAILGLQQLSTYIQSGNVVFRSTECDASYLQSQIEKKITDDFGYEVKVLIRNVPELHQIIEHNPFLETGSEDTSKLYIALLSEIPEEEDLERLLAFHFPHDEYKVIGKEIYMNCLNGYGNTKLSNDFFEKKLKQKATTRNWRTMLKMQEMLQALE